MAPKWVLPLVRAVLHNQVFDRSDFSPAKIQDLYSSLQTNLIVVDRLKMISYQTW